MKKIRAWKIIYAFCCLAYMGWTINVGTNEFDRINSQYRQLVDQLDEGRIRTKALEELTAEWCRESKGAKSARDATRDPGGVPRQSVGR